jgi:hypothetical protein
MNDQIDGTLSSNATRWVLAATPVLAAVPFAQSPSYAFRTVDMPGAAIFSTYFTHTLRRHL